MLWQHAFLETRWRFLVGLVVLPVSAAFIALGYPQVIALSQNVTAVPDTALGREIATAMEMAKRYDSYVWSEWFQQNGAQLGAFFAVIIGTGGLLSQGAAARLFTLSLPVSREQLLGARAAVGLGQVLALCAGAALRALDQITGGAGGFSLLRMMHGDAYFNGQGLPWPMLLVSTGLSLALLYSGTRLIVRKDF